MTNEAVLSELTTIFRDVFQDNTLEATREMTANDVDRWDSLSHIDMIVMVEEHFKFRIPTWQAAKLANVGELVDLVCVKLNS